MRPVYIVVEGITEKTFIDECLKPYWIEHFGLYEVYATQIGRPGEKGGDVRLERVLENVQRHLKQQPDSYVTTFFDYYGNKLKKLEGYSTCESLSTATQRIACLEQGLYDLVASPRFIPFLQKHEFESLIFSSGKALTSYLTDEACQAIIKIRDDFAGPENINTNNSASHRLAEIFDLYQRAKYSKKLYGSILALEIGLPTILKECPRFAAWVERIGKLAQQ
jgi:hypothetical protein